MIIRMTVLDNDYWKLLKNFAENLTDKILYGDSSRENTRKAVEIFSKSANNEVLTNEDRGFIYLRVNRAFSDYVNRVISDDKEKHYLISNFCVEIVDKFYERYENGEYVYYFSNINIVVSP